MARLVAAEEFAARFLDTLQRRPALAVERVYAQRNVGPAGRVLDQMDEPHGIGLLPRIGEFHFGREIGELRVQVELVALDERHHGDAGEALRNGSGTEDRVGCRRDLGCGVGIAITFQQHDLAIFDHGDCCTRHVALREHVGETRVELVDRLRSLVLGLCCREDSQRTPCSADRGSHTTLPQGPAAL